MNPPSEVEVGDLDLTSGLLLLLNRALDQAKPGDEVVVTGTDASLIHDLPAWCRISGHEYSGSTAGEAGRTRHRIRRGEAERLNLPGRVEWGAPLTLRGGKEADTRDWFVGRSAAIPEAADPSTGFAPRGGMVERGAPAYPFTLTERDRVWAAEVADLYEQATANQWDASRDVAWDRRGDVPRELEQAVCQVMTFLVENEFSALYVPAKFVPRIHPHFQEVVMFLATQIVDEARHVEAFTKRALLGGGGIQYSVASTQLSLKSLMDQEEFTQASFLLSVLGEGTFLDLLRFIETNAPDPVTAEVVRRARVDEARHVNFGTAHVRYFLRGNPNHAEELMRAARARRETLQTIAAPSPLVQDALAVLAARSLSPGAIRSGVSAVKGLMGEMHENRVKRLVSAGFTPDQSEELSTMHTPNFM